MTGTSDPDGTTLIWDRVETGGCVYVLAFTNGDLKVGKTTHLRQRFNTHVSAMRRRYHTRLVDFYFTRTHVGYSCTEDIFIGAVTSLMTTESYKTGREWFHGIDLERLQETLLVADPTNSYSQAPVGRAA